VRLFYAGLGITAVFWIALFGLLISAIVEGRDGYGCPSSGKDYGMGYGEALCTGSHEVPAPDAVNRVDLSQGTQLTWRDPYGGPLSSEYFRGYRVYRRDPSDEWRAIADVCLSPTTAYTFFDPSSGAMTYEYGVRTLTIWTPISELVLAMPSP
jgi:hypothetical protein